MAGDTVLALACPTNVITVTAAADLSASITTNGLGKTYSLAAGAYTWTNLVVATGDICIIGQGSSPDDVVITMTVGDGDGLDDALDLGAGSKLGVKVCVREGGATLRVNMMLKAIPLTTPVSSSPTGLTLHLLHFIHMCITCDELHRMSRWMAQATLTLSVSTMARCTWNV